MTEQKQIDDGERIEAFLADPAVQGAVDRLKLRYYDEFMNAPDAEISRVRAKTQVLVDILTELRIVEHTGKIARATRARRERNHK